MIFFTSLYSAYIWRSTYVGVWLPSLHFFLVYIVEKLFYYSTNNNNTKGTCTYSECFGALAQINSRTTFGFNCCQVEINVEKAVNIDSPFYWSGIYDTIIVKTRSYDRILFGSTIMQWGEIIAGVTREGGTSSIYTDG